MQVRCHLVLGQNQSGKIVAKRVTRGRGWIDADEAVIALELDVPEDVFDAPLFTVEVGKRQVEVAIEALDVEE
jgi:hypothetical protein